MADNKREPTAAEAMLFFSIVKHTRNKADVDWTAVATEAGFKNADVAKVRFGQVKRKLGISTETTAAPRAPATPERQPAVVSPRPLPLAAPSRARGRTTRSRRKRSPSTSLTMTKRCPSLP
ncbi:hypothetical protein NXS19_010101 [Fusarium pseudograminearum]|nr:hypothetical protein NXS19_010101 [Fusarium pseudograminearum]